MTTPEHPVDVEVQDGRVVGARPQPLDPLAHPAHVRDERFAVGPDERAVVDEAVRERVDLLEDHRVDVRLALLAGLREHRDGPRRPRQPPLVGDDVGHRAPGAVRRRVQERLRQPVGSGGAELVDVRGVAEGGHRPAGEPRCDLALDRAARSGARSRGSLPPTPAYWTLTQSPCAT